MLNFYRDLEFIAYSIITNSQFRTIFTVMENAKKDSVLSDASAHFLNGHEAGSIATEQRIQQLENELAKLQKEIRYITESQEENEKTSMLVASNIALARSNKSLQEFASIASHDLQEPLRKIKTFTSILKHKFSEELPPAAAELISKTQDAATRMSVLIKDVLNYSRTSGAEDSFVQTDLASIIGNVIRDFDLLAEEKTALIRVQKGIPFIEAIPMQMNQLFYNLIGNALKFTSDERLPVIDISWKELNKEEVDSVPGLLTEKTYFQFILKDNGIGFDQEFAEQIFSVFERLNSAKAYEGTGIGLALCRKIVDNHGGIIYAQGEERKGSSFFIILPSEH